MLVSSYFDEGVLKQEHDKLFNDGIRYVGHQLSVPNVGDYVSVESEDNGRLLIRTIDGIRLLSNACKHRQAVMLIGKGNSTNIVCPLHRWTYDLDGTLIGAPHFNTTPCKSLQDYPIKNWNGVLFESKIDINAILSKSNKLKDFNFDGYELANTKIHHSGYNWKTFIEVYLEDYHVEPFHPGLSSAVNCSDLEWEFGEQYSVQTVGWREYDMSSSGSPVYKAWRKELHKLGLGSNQKYGAIWLTIYPNITIEWYPEVMVVSTVWSDGAQNTKNIIEFYYPEEIRNFEPRLMQLHQAAYMETCLEDDEIGSRMDAGRKSLMLRGEEDQGPYQEPMELGMRHFHNWYDNALGVDHA
jgi:choline monooxygenase